MQRHAIIYTSILLIISAVYSCGKKPSYVIPREKMMDVLYDIQLAQAIYKNSSSEYESSAKKDALIAGILEKYDISQAELDSSLVWYADNINIYIQINDSVRNRLRAKADLLMNMKSAMDANNQKKNGIALPSVFYLTEATPTLSFNLDSLRIKNENLSPFRFKFDVQGLPESQTVEAALFFTYKDTLVKQIITIDRNTNYIFDTPQLPDSLLKSISGYTHLKNNRVGGTPRVILYNIIYSDSTSNTNNDILPDVNLENTTDESRINRAKRL